MESGDLQAQEPASQKTTPTSPSRRRWLVPALVGGAAVIVAFVIGAVLVNNDEEPVSQYAEAAVGGEPAAILGLFAESYRTGDVESALPFFDEDLHVQFTSLGNPLTWMPAMIEFEEAFYGRDEPGPSVCRGPNESGWVSCTFTETADVTVAGFPETTYEAKVADGRIVEWTGPRTVDIFERPIGEYAAEIDPEGMAAHCNVARAFEAGELTSGLPVVFNQQCGTFLAGFVDDYQATLDG